MMSLNTMLAHWMVIAGRQPQEIQDTCGLSVDQVRQIFRKFQRRGNQIALVVASAPDTRLRAAAPDLLEALEMVRDADDDNKSDGNQGIPSAARHKIDAAIAKARGLS